MGHWPLFHNLIGCPLAKVSCDPDYTFDSIPPVVQTGVPLSHAIPLTDTDKGVAPLGLPDR